MKRLLFLFLCFGLFACGPDSELEVQSDPLPDGDDFVATDRSGKQYPGLDPFKIYCGPGWGRKFCHFLGKYDRTVWADSENYYSDFSDIQFANFPSSGYFISFFDLESMTSYCDGWKLGESTYEGEKWNIEIKKDEEDAFWFEFEYYGLGDEIEYSRTYKYEVIDGLLHFSNEEQTFIFHPSEKDYAKDAVDTGEIIVTEGCLFY